MVSPLTSHDEVIPMISYVIIISLALSMVYITNSPFLITAQPVGVRVHGRVRS
jgi:hypothetical protein